jgi:hypothetical protein
MSNRVHEDISPGRSLIWLPGIALGALAALLVWPQTHRVVAAQLRLAIPSRESIAGTMEYTDSKVTDYVSPIIAKCAAEHSSILSQQIAAATTLPPDSSERKSSESLPDSASIHYSANSPAYKVVRLQSLIPRFEDQPALYATVLRYTTQGKVRLTRNEAARFLDKRESAQGSVTIHSQPADVEMFNRECITAERLDPDNGFFPMMQAIGLFESHNDAQALAAVERAAACNHWTEYMDCEYDGEVGLQAEAFGDPGSMPRAAFAAALLLPHLASIRGVAEVLLYEAVEAEQVGKLTYGLRLRTAVRRVGSLMRCESRTLIGALVGISLVKMSLLRTDGSPAPSKLDIFVQKDARDALLHTFDGYLASAGSSADSTSVHAEVDACVKTRAIISAGMGKTVFDGDLVSTLELSMVDMIVLSSVVWTGALALLICLLAAAAASRPVVRMRRAHRFALMTAMTLVGGSAVVALLVQQSVGSVGIIAHQSQIWFNLTDDTLYAQRALHILSDGYIGLIAAIPVLALITLGGLCLIWRTPLLPGIARGFRGCTVPLCSLLIIGYSILVPITSTSEARFNSRLTDAFQHEGRALARMLGKDWPGLIK